MAKKNKSRGGRGANVTASPRLHASPSVSPNRVTNRIFARPSVSPPAAPGVEDGRVWHPSGDARPAFDTAMRPNPRIVLKDRPSLAPRWGSSPKRIKAAGGRSKRPVARALHTKAFRAFESPSKVLVCVKRKVRREVIHALSKAGRGRRSRPKYGPHSSISCR